MQIKIINNVVLFHKYFERHELHLDWITSKIVRISVFVQKPLLKIWKLILYRENLYMIRHKKLSLSDISVERQLFVQKFSWFI